MICHNYNYNYSLYCCTIINLKGAFGRVYLGNVINPEDNILTGNFNQKIAIKTIKSK